MAEPSQPARDSDTTRATAHLPGLDIEIVHRLSPNRDAELLSINMQAVPSFEAFGRWVEAMNPFTVWMQAAQLFWSPWLGLANAGLFPGSAQPIRPRGAGAARDERP